MTDVETSRLVLHPIDEVEGRHIAAGKAGPDDAWAPDFPFDGDVAGIGGFLRANERFGEQRPFGHYVVIRRADGLAVGGIGFKGGPRDGRVEVGYGLVPSARGHGYTAEALTALLRVAADHGVHTVVADTAVDNVASQRTLLHAGFSRIAADPDPDADDALEYYEIRLGDPTATQRTGVSRRTSSPAGPGE